LAAIAPRASAALPDPSLRLARAKVNVTLVDDIMPPKMPVRK